MLACYAGVLGDSPAPHVDVDGGQPEPAQVLTGDILFDPPSGTFRDALQVSLSTEASSAEIHFTVDGSVPNATSSLYSGSPVAITATTQLLAQAFVAGAAVGHPGTAIYIKRAIDVNLDLPIIVLDKYGAGPLNTQDRASAQYSRPSFCSGRFHGLRG
jgi:hypothetical protein